MIPLTRALARCLCGLLAVASLALPVLAGEKVKFNPVEHLEGFSEITKSEYKELYALDRFYDLFDREMDETELAAEQKRWKEEVARVKPIVAGLQQDPLKRFRHELEKGMKSDAALKKRTFEEDTSIPGWIVKTEKPFQGKPNLLGRRVSELSPWILELTRIFEEQYAKPDGLTKRANSGAYALIVFETPQDYLEYAGDGARGALAVYDPSLPAVVTCQDLKDKRPDAEQAYPVLRSVVQAMLHAHYQGRGSVVPQVWLYWGLAEFLSKPAGASPATLDEHDGQPLLIDLLVRLASDRNGREVSLLPLLDLVQISSREDVISSASKRAKSLNRAEFDRDGAFAAFVGEAFAWVEFLHEARAGEYRPVFDAYLQHALAGEGGSASMRAALGDAEPAEIEEAFWGWVFDRYEERHPDVKLDRELIDRLKERAQADKEAAVVAQFRPDVFQPHPDEPEAWRGRAIVCAKRGDLDGAAAILTESSATATSGTDELKRELVRVQGALALRQALLEALGKKEQFITFPKDGKPYKNLKVTKVDKTRLVFGSNGQGITDLDLATLPVSALAQLCDPKLVGGSAPLWARTYLWILAGDPRSKRPFKDDSEEGKALRAESPQTYEGLEAIGAAAEALLSLARLGTPEKLEEARHVHETLAGLRPALALPLVSKRREALSILAKIVVTIESQALAPSDFLLNKPAPIEGGRIRLVYDFTAPDDAADFVLDREVGQAIASELNLSRGRPGAMTLQGGSARFTGSGYWKLRLPLKAPLRAKFRARAKWDFEGGASSHYIFGLRMLDSGGAMAQVGATGGTSWALANGQIGKSPSQPGWDGSPQEVEVLYDGKVLRALIDGKQVASNEVSGLSEGALGFFVGSDHVMLLDELEIEADAPKTVPPELRNAWIAKETAILGF